jgi:formyl-CoA transferase
MLAPINDAREIVASRQLAAREFFVDVGDDPPLRHPGAFARSSATRIGIRCAAPRLGEHTAEVLATVGVDAGELARLRAEGVA